MIDDPFLASHQLLERVFLLSCRGPISIRDQMIRGVMLVERLKPRFFGKHPTEQLLIVGAGAGGMTAAITALELGIKVTILDRASLPFNVQSAVKTRWMDPVHYDWPLDHWGQGEFRWALHHRKMPLPYPADWAGDLAAQWSTAWKVALGNLRVTAPLLRRIDKLELKPRGNQLEASWLDYTDDPNGSPHGGNFDVVLWAAGFGPEDVRVDDSNQKPSDPDPYFGPEFWETDRLLQPRAGLEAGKTPKVLISGSGDGGLQDYLRVVAGFDAAGDLARKLNLPPDVVTSLQSVEDRGYRGRLWGPADGYLEDLETHHKAAIHVCLKDLNVSDELTRVLEARSQALFGKALGDLPGDGLRPATLIFQGSHLSGVYGLNRFLVGLIAARLEELGIETLRSKRTLLSVEPADKHECSMRDAKNALVPHMKSIAGKTVRVCDGREHLVTIGEVTANQRIQREPAEEFNIIIVRHGLVFSKTGIELPIRDRKNPKRKYVIHPSRPSVAMPFHLMP